MIPDRFTRRAALAALALAALAGCAGSNPGGLPRRTFTIGGHDVELEIAATDPERSRGFMFRESIPEDEGMLFLFSHEEERSFWMMNCLTDMSIAYLDASGKIVSLAEMKHPEPGTPEGVITAKYSYPSNYPAQFAIEMRAGWFRDHGVKPGTVVEIPRDVRAMTQD